MLIKGLGCCFIDMKKKDFDKIINKINDKNHTKYDILSDIPTNYLSEIFKQPEE